MASPISSDTANVWDLQFDRKNPRLVEMDISEDTPDLEIIQILWDAMDVQELILSMATCGFFRHEPLIVEEGTQVVMEGNRRLAAIRLCLDQELAQKLNASSFAVGISQGNIAGYSSDT